MMKVYVITSTRGFEAVAATKTKADQVAEYVKRDLQVGGYRDDRVTITQTKVFE